MGRLIFHVLGAVAEFAHDLVVERTRVGLAAAGTRGRKGGRPSKLRRVQVKQARTIDDSREYTVQQIADTLNVSRATIYRQLGPGGNRPK